MLEDFTYDSLLQICQVVQGKVKVYKKKKIHYQHCEECNVERIMHSNSGFYVCPSCGVCGDDIFVVGYVESALMHKKRKCICKRWNIFDRNWKVLMSITFQDP